MRKNILAYSIVSLVTLIAIIISNLYVELDLSWFETFFENFKTKSGRLDNAVKCFIKLFIDISLTVAVVIRQYELGYRK